MRRLAAPFDPVRGGRFLLGSGAASFSRPPRADGVGVWEISGLGPPSGPGGITVTLLDAGQAWTLTADLSLPADVPEGGWGPGLDRGVSTGVRVRS